MNTTKTTKKLKIYNLYELPKKLYKELYLEKDKEYQLFEGDPDYLLDKDWYPVYFMKYWNYLIIDNYSEDFDHDYEDIISKFFEDNFEDYFESIDNNWWSFKEYDWIKIAYRGWSWYVYSLWWYKDN